MERWSVDRHEELDLDDIRDVRVRLVAGEVALTAAPGPAHVEVRRTHGRPVTVVVDDGLLDIAYENGELWGGLRDEAVVVVTAPAGTNVDVGLVSSSLVIGGFSGPVRATTVSGGVTLADLDGEIAVRTVSGDIEARGLSGPLSANTISGQLAVAQGHCPSLDAKAVSGNLTLDLVLDPGGTYDFGTVSGDVTLRVDEGSGVDVKAATMSGRINVDLPIERHRSFVGQRAEGRVGDGGAALRIKTMSGRVDVVRPAPA